MHKLRSMGVPRIVVVAVATVVVGWVGVSPAWADEEAPSDPPPTTAAVPVTTEASPPGPAVGDGDGDVTEPAGSDPAATDPAGTQPPDDSSGGSDAPSDTQPDAATSGDASTGTSTGTPAGEPAADTVSPAGDTGTGSDADPAAAADATTVSTSAIDQSTDVVGTQVSVADTGHNTSVTTGTTAGDASGTGNTVTITTGSSTAVGNQEQTAITQQAITTLTGNATAEIVQISIVFNIGGAYAVSGANTAAAIGSGGVATSTSTGSATAIGNDSQTYVTQAGSAAAAGAQVSTVTQHTVTMQIGVATANTGANTIVATVADGSGGAATIVSGGATAIGNDSQTAVEQMARAVGSGNSELTIEQWVTVINLGVALANTGANDIGDMLAAAWASPDGGTVAELFGLLLPALLADGSAMPGALVAADGASGTISTGDASAIGNRSTTSVQQVALATASGDGSARVQQEVLVVNAGAATANSGRNQTGAGVSTASPAPLGAAEQAVVQQLTAFVNGLLAEINAWANGTDTDIASSSLTAQLGGQLVVAGGDFTASTGQTTTAGGVLASVRQLSAVISLGVAVADSGHNLAVTSNVSANGSEAVAEGGGDGTTGVQQLNALVAVADAVSIVTGDAVAHNRALVVVCQLANMADHPCLGPEDDPGAASPPPAEGSAVGSQRPAALQSAARSTAPAQPGGAAPAGDVRSLTAGQAPRQSLPATGSDPLPLVLFGAGAVLVGAVLVASSRRRIV
jgi:LPXTG-motif cell wall-anchored protein